VPNPDLCQAVNNWLEKETKKTGLEKAPVISSKTVLRATGRIK
jgi:hypothetical protein